MALPGLSPCRVALSIGEPVFEDWRVVVYLLSFVYHGVCRRSFRRIDAA